MERKWLFIKYKQGVCTAGASGAHSLSLPTCKLFVQINIRLLRYTKNLERFPDICPVVFVPGSVIPRTEHGVPGGINGK